MVASPQLLHVNKILDDIDMAIVTFNDPPESFMGFFPMGRILDGSYWWFGSVAKYNFNSMSSMNLLCNNR